MQYVRMLPRTLVIAGLVLSICRVASAVIPIEVQQCRRGIAAFSRSLVQKSLKAIQKCKNKALRDPSSCPAPQPSPALEVFADRLRNDVGKACGGIADNLLGTGYLNYPGPCTDPTPNDGFNVADLMECLVNGHEAVVNRLIDIEYDTVGPLDAATVGCQKIVGKAATRFMSTRLKAIQKCRNAIDAGTLAILPETCATIDGKTAATIAHATTKLRMAIPAHCTAAEVQTLGICANPVCATFCGSCDASCVAECLLATHADEMDGPGTNGTTLIGYEYAPPPPPPVCGDARRDRPAEECDGADDGACPGHCGTPQSAFPCLCITKPRERVVEHSNTDLDTGWTGLAHDFKLVEGGGYFLDLYDCDGPQGPDTICTVGPSCSGAPHPPCSKDADCSGLGICRKEGTAVGPHCKVDVKKSCTCNLESTAQPACIDDVDCPGVGNLCLQQFHTPPLPLSAGGVPVCVVNVFTNDISGTKNLANGSMAVRLQQKSIVQMTGTPAQPCPVCGGFCKASAGDLAGRHNCTTNADCADTTSQTCVTDFLCNTGSNEGEPCRPDPPYGGPTPLFGNPSIDCPPTLSSPGILDIVFDPQTTETVSLAPNYQCNAAGFSGKTCVGGGNQGANCTTSSECPGGTCNNQCFCPAVGGVREAPNGCGAACVGGGNDAEPCTFDSQCAGGFCHLADCRPDLSAPAALQPNEGGCTATIEGRCSYSSYRSCVRDADCAPPTCSRCSGGETCQFFAKDCYINSGITRTGAASPTDPVLSAIFCIAGTGQSAVDTTAGLPGAGAIRQPSTVIDTGF